MIYYIGIKIYLLHSIILCVCGELHLRIKESHNIPMQSTSLHKFFQNKFIFPGIEDINYVRGDNRLFHQKVGFDYQKVIPRNFAFQSNERGTEFVKNFLKISSDLAGVNFPFLSKDASEQVLYLSKLNPTTSSGASSGFSQVSEDKNSDSSNTGEIRHSNNDYTVEIKPGIATRSIIIPNMSCQYGYRKDRIGRCRKIL